VTLDGRNMNQYESLTTAEKKKNHNNSQYNSQLFSLENVSLHFKGILKTKKALSGVSLSISKGDILFVTGASGAGKTSLLNIIAGDVKPTSGRVQLNNSVQLKKGPREFCARIFQDLKLIDFLSCEENLWVAYDKALYGNKNEFQNDISELSKILGIEDSLHVKVKDANGGLKQKIAIIRTLLTRPTVVLADEPTCSMDKQNAMKVFDVLNYYNVKRGLTVIWASHNRELVKNFPGQIIHLDNGKLVYSGHACFI
jgi:ABC-type multidrug transport system ATPase subunit